MLVFFWSLVVKRGWWVVVRGGFRFKSWVLFVLLGFFGLFIFVIDWELGFICFFICFYDVGFE